MTGIRPEKCIIRWFCHCVNFIECTCTNLHSIAHIKAILNILLILGYKPVQHVTVPNTVGNCNTMVSIIILYYNVVEPRPYMQFILDQNIIMRCMTLQIYIKLLHNLQSSSPVMAVETDRCINRICMDETNTA